MGFYLFIGGLQPKGVQLPLPLPVLHEKAGPRHKTYIDTLPPQHWLVKHDCHKLGLEPVRDPQSNHGSCVLLLDVKVVQNHGLRLRQRARFVLAWWEAQQRMLEMRWHQWGLPAFIFISRNRVAVARNRVKVGLQIQQRGPLPESWLAIIS